VTAGDQKRECREFELFEPAVTHHRKCDVPFHVIDRDDRQVPDMRERLREIHADPERGFKSGTVRDRDRINIRPRVLFQNSARRSKSSGSRSSIFSMTVLDCSPIKDRP